MCAHAHTVLISTFRMLSVKNIFISILAEVNYSSHLLPYTFSPIFGFILLQFLPIPFKCIFANSINVKYIILWSLWGRDIFLGLFLDQDKFLWICSSVNCLFVFWVFCLLSCLFLRNKNLCQFKALQIVSVRLSEDMNFVCEES